MSDGNRDADDPGMPCCGGLRTHAYDCTQRSGPPMRETCQGVCDCGAKYGAIGELGCICTESHFAHCPGCPTVHPAAPVPPGELTPARLEELARLYGQMTPGPWTVDEDETMDGDDVVYRQVSILEISRCLHHDEWADAKDWPRDVANARGIVALVNAFPALLAAAREREELNETIGALDRAAQEWCRRNRELAAQVATLTAELEALKARPGAADGQGGDRLSPEERVDLEAVRSDHAKGRVCDQDAGAVVDLLAIIDRLFPKPADDGGPQR